MRVLVTGAKGFVGCNLCEALKAIRDGKDRRERFQTLLPLEVMECDIETTAEELDEMCAKADYVFNLAGVNRPQDPAEFMVNYDSFFVEGDVKTQADEAYTSHNTERLDISGTVEKIKTAEYVQLALEGREHEAVQ